MSGGFNNQNQIEAPEYEGSFIGTVVDNDDPERLQRVKVLIPGLLEAEPSLLPWIAPSLHSYFGVTTNAGEMQVPVLGSTLEVVFQRGDLNYGMYRGYLHTARHAPDPDLLKNYPNRRGWVDPAGNKFWMDITPRGVITHYEHPTGTMFTIDSLGNLTVEVVANTTLNVLGNTSITTQGNTSVTTSGNTAVSTNGNTSISTGGSTSISTQGDTSVTSGGNASISAGGKVDINASANCTVSTAGLLRLSGSSILIG